MKAPAIAVFGGSESLPGDPDYERARRIGGLLASGGAAVVCGGYGGVMEGASRGARESGGEVIGVCCAAFRGRTPNPWLSSVLEEPDLFSRTARLIALSSGFIILPGKSGTLAELAFLWALRRGGFMTDRPVVLLGESWAGVLRFLVAANILEEDTLADTRVAETERQAVAEALGGAPGSRRRE